MPPRALSINSLQKSHFWNHKLYCPAFLDWSPLRSPCQAKTKVQSCKKLRQAPSRRKAGNFGMLSG